MAKPHASLGTKKFFIEEMAVLNLLLGGKQESRAVAAHWLGCCWGRQGPSSCFSGRELPLLASLGHTGRVSIQFHSLFGMLSIF